MILMKNKPDVLDDAFNAPDMLYKIVKECLWYESHLFGEIIDKISDTDHGFVGSRRMLKKRVCYTLKEALTCNYIELEKGFFRLTVCGRVALQVQLGIND